MADPQTVNPVTPPVIPETSSSSTLESRPVVDLSASANSPIDTSVSGASISTSNGTPQKKTWPMIAIIIAAALLIIAGAIFILLNFRGSGGVALPTDPDQDELTYNPRQPFSRQMTPEQVAFSTNQTLDLFFRNRDNRNLYPATINCNISATDCTSDLPNHRNGFAILWANYRALLINPDDSAALERLTSDLAAYQDLINSKSVIFQNNSYDCSLMREISTLPTLSPAQVTTLKNICFTSNYENNVYDPSLPTYTAAEAMALINQKLTDLSSAGQTSGQTPGQTSAAQTIFSDPATTLLTSRSADYPQSIISTYNKFVVDEADRVLWEKELGGPDNLDIDQAYVDVLYNAAVFNPDVDYTASTLNDYNILLSAYYLYQDQITTDQLLGLALANQKIAELLPSLGQDPAAVTSFQNQLLTQLNYAAPPAAMTQLANSVYPLVKLNGLGANVQTSFANKIIDNFYYYDGQLAGFSNSRTARAPDGSTAHSFDTYINGMFSGMLVR